MAKSTNPFRYFDSSPELIQLVVMMYVRYRAALKESGAANRQETER